MIIREDYDLEFMYNDFTKFEWDQHKNEINIKKHHIDFEDAKYVFTDPDRIVNYDLTHSRSENRFIVIGQVGDIILVVFTIRSGDTARIVSARSATSKEVNEYYDGYFYD